MFEVGWYDELHEAVLMTVQGDWTWAEYYDAAEKVRHLMRTAPDNIIDVLVDLRSNAFPRGSITMHGIAAIRHPEPNLRYVIVTSPNQVMFRLMQVMLSLNSELSKRYKVCKTMDSALDLYHARERIAW